MRSSVVRVIYSQPHRLGGRLATASTSAVNAEVIRTRGWTRRTVLLVETPGIPQPRRTFTSGSVLTSSVGPSSSSHPPTGSDAPIQSAKPSTPAKPGKEQKDVLPSEAVQSDATSSSKDAESTTDSAKPSSTGSEGAVATSSANEADSTLSATTSTSELTRQETKREKRQRQRERKRARLLAAKAQEKEASASVKDVQASPAPPTPTPKGDERWEAPPPVQENDGVSKKEATTEAQGEKIVEKQLSASEVAKQEHEKEQASTAEAARNDGSKGHVGSTKKAVESDVKATKENLVVKKTAAGAKEANSSARVPEKEVVVAEDAKKSKEKTAMPTKPEKAGEVEAQSKDVAHTGSKTLPAADEDLKARTGEENKGAEVSAEGQKGPKPVVKTKTSKIVVKKDRSSATRASTVRKRPKLARAEVRAAAKQAAIEAAKNEAAKEEAAKEEAAEEAGEEAAKRDSTNATTVQGNVSKVTKSVRQTRAEIKAKAKIEAARADIFLASLIKVKARAEAAKLNAQSASLTQVQLKAAKNKAAQLDAHAAYRAKIDLESAQEQLSPQAFEILKQRFQLEQSKYEARMRIAEARAQIANLSESLSSEPERDLSVQDNASIEAPQGSKSDEHSSSTPQPPPIRPVRYPYLYELSAEMIEERTRNNAQAVSEGRRLQAATTRPPPVPSHGLAQALFAAIGEQFQRAKKIIFSTAPSPDQSGITNKNGEVSSSEKLFYRFDRAPIVYPPKDVYPPPLPLVREADPIMAARALRVLRTVELVWVSNGAKGSWAHKVFPNSWYEKRDLFEYLDSEQSISFLGDGLLMFVTRLLLMRKYPGRRAREYWEVTKFLVSNENYNHIYEDAQLERERQVVYQIMREKSKMRQIELPHQQCTGKYISVLSEKEKQIRMKTPLPDIGLRPVTDYSKNKADVFEAYVGAVFLTFGFDTTIQWLEPLLDPWIDRVGREENILKHPMLDAAAQAELRKKEGKQEMKEKEEEGEEEKEEEKEAKKHREARQSEGSWLRSLISR